MKLLLTLFILMQGFIYADTHDVLPFSGGKYGDKKNIDTIEVFQNPSDSSKLRTDCYTHVWMHSKISYNFENYFVYQKLKISASTKGTYGTSTASCNIAWNAPVISVQLEGTEGNVYNDRFGQLFIKSKTLYNASYVSISETSENYGISWDISGWFSPQLRWAQNRVNYAFSEHRAGGMYGSLYLGIN